MSAAFAFVIGFWFGLPLGVSHFASLEGVTRRLVVGRAVAALVLQLARMALLVLVLVACAVAGAATLLGAVAGLALARPLVLARMARRA